MKIWYHLVAVLTTATLACSTPTETDAPVIEESPVATMAAVVAGTASIGNSVTVRDAGWKRSFGGAINVESDATVIYAVVFGGTGGRAPVTGVTVGGQAFTKVKSAMGDNLSSIDIYRLASPQVGSSRTIAVARGSLGYDPVRVTLFTVRGANASDPNGVMTTLDLTPGTATATKTVNIASSTGGLTISTVVASPAYLDVAGVQATSGFQRTVASGEDDDGWFGVVGSAPGAGSVTHSWNLRADAPGRTALLLSFSINAGSTTPDPTLPTTPPPTEPAVIPGGAAAFGSVVTLRDAGWVQPFTSVINVESDATVAYAVVFNGSAAGNAPISGVSVGGQPMTRIKSAERTVNASLDVFRLVSPRPGSQTIAVTHSKLGYDPVRVTVFTVRGANTSNPNGAVTEVDLTPGAAIMTRTVSVLSSTDGLTISAVAASGAFADGNGVTATPGFQTMRAASEDDDGTWGAMGSAPGAVSVVHSYDLRADAAGRSIYAVSFTVNGASGAPAPPPPPPPPTPLPPAPSAGWTTLVDYDFAQNPAHYPGNYNLWTSYERPWELMLYANLTQISDPTQPGAGSPGAARVWFPATLPGGYAPINFGWNGTWPANDGSVDLTFTLKLSANWDNNGPLNRNDGTKLFFFAKARQNNHFIGFVSRRYDGAEAGGSGTLGGAWLMLGLQAPTVSYKTNIDLTRDVWHTIRMQVIANTPGVANGQLRLWVDGVPALINTGKNDVPRLEVVSNVLYYSSGQQARQERLELEPTYGGGVESPPYMQWFDIGNVTAAYRP